MKNPFPQTPKTRQFFAMLSNYKSLANARRARIETLEREVLRLRNKIAELNVGLDGFRTDLNSGSAVLKKDTLSENQTVWYGGTDDN